MLILASKSPRRHKLLSDLGIRFRTAEPKCVEEAFKGQSPSEYCISLASLKAHSVGFDSDDDIILAADTVVSLDDTVFGKPADKAEAREMLRKLSGKEHKVYTGYCIRSKRKILTGVSRTKVNFRRLTDEMIDAYIETGEPMDKAGAYGIQGFGKLLVEDISGDYDNVVGLPISQIYHELVKHFGFRYFGS